MLERVTVTAADLAASRRFYETVLAALHGDPWHTFALAQAEEGTPPTSGLHVAFAARSRAEVDDFWRRGVDAGHRSDGEPGPRPQYAPDYYGGFLLDPGGNSAEAVHRSPRTESGSPIDHLWLRVRDLGASRRLWETLAPVLGLRVAEATLPGLVSVSRARRHLMLVADGRPPTGNVRLAFPVADDAAVADFHRAARAVARSDLGPASERPRHRGGSAGALVLEPDGWSVEAVVPDG